ncbi:phage protein [Vibrio phage pTD1]|uniref:Phage protein n=1 Tax=Vibrio phage pTD1 TaxID=1938577 RepID=A0A1Q2U2W7_9CAUD|nr:phage protein [Vibrio phage pTD1]BAW98303.1 phage protein [Vibrio phage pTD1]
MKILEFRNQLKPVKKQDLLTLIKNHKDFLEGIQDNLRLMESDGVKFSQAISGWADHQKFLKACRENAPTSISDESIIMVATNTISEVLDLLQKDFSAGPNLIGKETATIQQVNGLMLDSYISFWVDYMSRLMDMTTSMMVTGKVDKQVAQKPDLVFLNNELVRFAELTYLFFERGGIILKRYRSSPKIVADEQTIDVLEQTKGKDSTLVLPTKNIAPHTFNPVFWWENYQMERSLKAYERHQNSIEANAAKISYYQDLQHQNPSPANELMIAKLEDRIIKAQASMEAIEAKYA